MESKPIPEPPFDPNHLGPRLPALTSIRILYEPEDNFPRLSPLVPHTAPRIIMPDTRQLFEVSLTGPLDSNILPRLFQDVFGKPFEKSLEYSRLWKEVEEKLF